MLINMKTETNKDRFRILNDLMKNKIRYQNSIWIYNLYTIVWKYFKYEKKLKIELMKTNNRIDRKLNFK